MTELLVLRPDDAQALAMLHATCFPDPWSPASFRQMLAESHTLGLGAQRDGELVGFALVRTLAGDADLLTIATSPERQRNGIARTLMAALIRRMGERGATRITLDVAEDNAPARALYEAFAFTEDGRRPRYYAAGRKRPVDAVLMSRQLGLGSV